MARRGLPKYPQFLGLAFQEAPPDHTTVARTHRLIDFETHQAVFTWLLQQLVDAGLVKGRTIGIDATTLEANAALRRIVRRDSGERYEDFLTDLAQASGIETPARADLTRLDRERPHKGRNDDWQHPHDPDARITKMKAGRMHLAHKAEHGVDLDTGAIAAVTIHDATTGDTATLPETLTTAAEQVEAVQPDGEGPMEAVAATAYHSNQAPTDLEAVGIRAYIAEPDRGRQTWRGKTTAREAVYRNYRTGSLRRTHLRGHVKILTRLVIHASGANPALLMPTSFRVGTRGLQSRLSAALALRRALVSVITVLERCTRLQAPVNRVPTMVVTFVQD